MQIATTLRPTYQVETILTGKGGSLKLSPGSELITRLAPILRGAPGDPANVHLQTFAASQQWVVNHNLGREPHLQVLSPGGLEMLAHVVHVSVNQSVVYFATPQAGRVRCL